MVANRDESPGSVGAARPLVILHLMKTGGFSLLYQVLENTAPDTRWGLPEDGDDEIARMVRYSSVARLRALDPAATARLELVMGHFPFAVVELAGLEGATVATVVRDPVSRVVSYLQMCQRTNAEHRDLPLEQIYEEPFFGPRTIDDHQTKMLGMTLAQATSAPTPPEAPPHPEIVAALIADGYFESEEFAREMQTARFILETLDTPVVWPVPTDRSTLDQAVRNLDRVDILGVHDEYDDFLGRLAAHTGWRIDESIRANRGEDASVSPSFRRRIEDGNQLDLELYEHARSVLRRTRS